MNYLTNLWQALDLHSLLGLVLRLASVLLCLCVHELCHALCAYALGDPTAKLQHRLSLNPLRHIDWFGFAMLAVAGFGWAKPVPVNPGYFKRPKLGMALTDASGQQVTTAAENGRLYFVAQLPAFGYATYQCRQGKRNSTAQKEGRVASADEARPTGQRSTLHQEATLTVLENSLYRLEVDMQRGGTLRHLILKQQGGRDLVDSSSDYRFGELRGYFPAKGRFCSSTENGVRETWRIQNEFMQQLCHNQSYYVLFLPLALERCRCRACHEDVAAFLIPGNIQTSAEQIEIKMAVCEIIEHAGDS